MERFVNMLFNVRILAVILVNYILTCMGLEFSLEGNETGRYLYTSETKPASMFYCTYCPDDLLNQDEIERNQEKKCATKAKLEFFESDPEEKVNNLYPFCKQAVGKIPGCGLIPSKEGLVFESNNSNFLRNNKSRVYEVYTAKCADGYVLNLKTTEYRCGENRKWNIDPYEIECLFQSAGTVSPDIQNSSHTHTILAVSIPVIIVLITVILTIRKKKRIQEIWYRSNKNNNSIELQPVSQFLRPVGKDEQTKGTLLTENVVNNTTISNATSTRKEKRNYLSSSGQKDKASSYLKVSPVEKISGHGQGHCYSVLEGNKIVFASTIKGDLSIQRLDHAPARGVKINVFLYVIENVQKVDTGQYTYSIMSIQENYSTLIIKDTFELIVKVRGEPDGLEGDDKTKIATSIEHTEAVEAEENDEDLKSKNCYNESNCTHEYILKDYRIYLPFAELSPLYSKYLVKTKLKN